MILPKFFGFHITEGDSREVTRLLPVSTTHKISQHSSTVEGDPCTDKAFHQVDLTHRIHHVEALYKAVESGKKISTLSATATLQTAWMLTTPPVMSTSMAT